MLAGSTILKVGHLDREKGAYLGERIFKSLLLEVPGVAAGGIDALLSVGCRDRSRRHLIREHEGKKAGQSRGRRIGMLQ